MASTIKDVARVTGLSLATISKYINGGNVRPENKVLLDKAIKQLDYSPNVFAQGLRGARSKFIALVIPDMDNSYSISLFARLKEDIAKIGYSLVVFCHQDNRNSFESILNNLKQMRVAGIVIDYFRGTDRDAEILSSFNVPVVCLDVALNYERFDCVLVDGSTATYRATQKLIESGHRKIGIITGSLTVEAGKQRFVGYTRALKDYHIPYDKSLVHYGNFSYSSGQIGMKKLWNQEVRPDAIISCNYIMSLGAFNAIVDMRLKVGEDFDFVGFDNIPLLKKLNPGAEFISQPVEKMTAKVSEILLKRLSGDYSDFPYITRLDAIFED